MSTTPPGRQNAGPPKAPPVPIRNKERQNRGTDSLTTNATSASGTTSTPSNTEPGLATTSGTDTSATATTNGSSALGSTLTPSTAEPAPATSSGADTSATATTDPTPAPTARVPEVARRVNVNATITVHHYGAGHTTADEPTAANGRAAADEPGWLILGCSPYDFILAAAMIHVSYTVVRIITSAWNLYDMSKKG